MIERLVIAVEAAYFVILTGEHPHHLRANGGFLQVIAQGLRPLHDLLPFGVNRLGKALRQRDQGQERDEGNRRQEGADVKHHRQRAKRQQPHIEQVHDAVSVKPLDFAHVGNGAGDNRPHMGMVMVAKRQV